MATYIHGMGNISPQQSWGDALWKEPPIEHTGNHLTCIEPDYTKYLDSQQLRRMSRILKMGVTAGKMALHEAGLTVPDCIITGTSYGCIEDTGIFLKKMVDNKELALNPTPFIQSTHNTIGSLIALLLKCQGYNQTFTQRAFSFESALLDAMLELKDNPAETILTGGVDGTTSYSHKILTRFGIFKNSPISNLELFKDNSDGTINGEGAGYFVLSGVQGNAKVSIDALTTFYRPSAKELITGIQQFLKSSMVVQPDLTLVGKCGDKRSDAATDEILRSIPTAYLPGLFKHLSGEYPTASAFALWLGARIIQNQSIPETVAAKNSGQPVKSVLIYNPYFREYHSLILLRAC